MIIMYVDYIVIMNYVHKEVSLTIEILDEPWIFMIFF